MKLNKGATSHTGAVVNAISDTNRVVVFITGAGVNRNYNNADSAVLISNLNSNKQPVFTRSANHVGSLSYAVVEFTGRTWSDVQRVEHSITNVGNDEIEIITPVATNRTFMHVQARASNTRNIGAQVWFSNTNELAFRREYGNNGHPLVAWIVENTETNPLYGINVQHIKNTRAAGAGSIPDQWTESINAVSSVSNASIMSESAWSTNFQPINLELTSADQVTLWKSLTNESSYYSFSVTEWLRPAPAPNMGIIGINGTSLIENNDYVTSTEDGTDFGSVANPDLGSFSVTNTFTITNRSVNGILFLTNTPNAVVLYQDSNDFSIAVDASPTTIMPGEAPTTFRIKFDPQTDGVRTALVSIAANTYTEPYQFAIRGTGVGADMDVYGNGYIITNADYTPVTRNDTDFGALNLVSGETTNTFTITNSGFSTLFLTNSPDAVVLYGHTGDFTVTSQPTTNIPVGNAATFDIVYSPTNTGIRTALVYIANSDVNNDPYQFAIQGSVVAPEIDVTGNGNSITNGDFTPRTGDDTDFGLVLTNNSFDTPHVFTINNTGSATLYLTNTPVIVISGDSNDFPIINQPGPGATIIAAWYDTFTIRFAPTVTGIRTGLVTILNDDLDEDPYQFSISGYGDWPETGVLGINGATIDHNDPIPDTADGTDFGSVGGFGGEKFHTFTITNENSGLTPVVLQGTPLVNIIGANPEDFLVTAQPATNSIGVSNSTPFTIMFRPIEPGLRTARVEIDNNDDIEDPYRFDIQGTGFNISEIDVYGNGNMITNNDSTPAVSNFTDFSWTINNTTNSKTFYITNTTPGNTNLYLTDTPYVDIPDPSLVVRWRFDDGSGTTASDFSPNGNDGTITDAVWTNGVTNGALSFNGTSSKVVKALPDRTWDAYSVSLWANSSLDTQFTNASVFNNSDFIIDCDTNSNYRYKGQKSDVFGPHLSNTWVHLAVVYDGVDTYLYYNGTANTNLVAADSRFRKVAVGVDHQDTNFFEGLIDDVRVYNRVISASEVAALAAFSPLPDKGEFTVSVQPTNDIPANQGTSFTIHFHPTNTGFKTGVVNIDNTDPDENPYRFYIAGRSLVPWPEIDIYGNGYEIADGDITPAVSNFTDFGWTVHSYGTNSRTFHITNEASAVTNLYLTNTPAITITGAGAGEFSVVTNSTSTNIPISGGTEFTVQFHPTNTGMCTGTVTIANNDPDENPYTFRIIGEGLASFAEMDVYGNGNIITNNDSSPSTDNGTYMDGALFIGSEISSNIFTITNAGTTNLFLTGTPSVVITGAHSNDFSVTDTPAINIAGLSSTTFTIAFDPGALGGRTGIVTIANTDTNESPYTFYIKAVGTEPEMDMSGNGNPISNGDDEPDTINNTDFGYVSFS
ncbi:choice-of-anchor D domain-containing protein, partial [Verrucomicrobiota bacterium]